MKARYVLAPEAARDLLKIWRFIKNESSQETADRVESACVRSSFTSHNTLAEDTGGAT